MCRLLQEFGYHPASYWSLNTRFIPHDKLSRQWGDVDNGELQTRLYRVCYCLTRTSS